MSMDSTSEADEPGRGGGPKTPEGKMKSRMNALRHGATATDLVKELMGEDAYEEVLAELHEEFDPCGPAEETLVKQLAQLMLSIDLTATQLRAVTRVLARHCDELQVTRNAGRDGALKGILESPAFGLARRYDTASMRSFQRVLRLLLERQAVRRKAEPADDDARRAVRSGHEVDSRILALEKKLDTDGGMESLIWELISGQPFDPSGTSSAAAATGDNGPDSQEVRSRLLEGWLQDSFLAKTDIPRRKFLLAAAELLLNPCISVTALRKRVGIRRRQTAQRLCRLIRRRGEAQRDAMLEALRAYLNQE